MQHQHMNMMADSYAFPDHYLRWCFYKQSASFSFFIMAMDGDTLPHDVVAYICSFSGLCVPPSPQHQYRNVDYRDLDLPSLPLWELLDHSHNGHFRGVSATRRVESGDGVSSDSRIVNKSCPLTEWESQVEREAAKYDAPLFHRIREYKRLGLGAGGIIQF
jgi:hypothetical protein